MSFAVKCAKMWKPDLMRFVFVHYVLSSDHFGDFGVSLVVLNEKAFDTAVFGCGSVPKVKKQAFISHNHMEKL